MDFGNLGGMASSGLTILVMSIMILFVGALAAGGTWLYMGYRRYTQYKCVIFNPNGYIESYDKAGVFVDRKTKNKRLFLLKNNVGLDPDNIPYKMNGKGDRVVYLVQDGLKNFKYVNIRFNGYSPQITVGEEDVNWAINAYEKQKKLFMNSTLAQLMPLLIIIVPSIIMLIIFIYFFKDFAVLKGIAEALKEAAEALAQAKAGTLVMAGGG